DLKMSITAFSQVHHPKTTKIYREYKDEFVYDDWDGNIFPNQTPLHGGGNYKEPAPTPSPYIVLVQGPPNT
ncbi:hypothetical protein MKX03_034749, partial [Papaver bracteatum]